MESTGLASNVVFEQGITNFSFSIYDAFGKNGNEFISPYSISAALLLLMLGTDGATKNQMMTSIFKGDTPADVHQGYKSLDDKLSSRTKSGVTLSIANRLFGSKIFSLLNSYTTKALQHYGSDVELLDFVDSEGSRTRINNWIASKTKNRIQNILPRGVLDATTVVVLANAIYFKGTWKTKFDPKDTTKRNFYVSSTIQKQVDMMYGKFQAESAETLDLDCKVLRLPYSGDKISMVIILPNDGNGLSQLEKKLTPVTFDKLLSKLKQQNTIIRLPKFKIQAEYDLIPVVKRLGITNIFDEKVSDFSKMVSPNVKSLYVSHARHKTFVEVNEEGSEAAAATVVVVKTRSMSISRPFSFVADHPFIFFIRDNEIFFKFR